MKKPKYSREDHIEGDAEDEGRSKIRELAVEKRLVGDELRKVSGENAELISAFRATLASLKENREKRGTFSTSAREMVTAKHKLIDESRKLTTEINAATAERPQDPQSLSTRRIEEQIERLEWKQQTEASPAMEKALAIEIKKLTALLPNARQSSESRQSLNELFDKRRAISQQIRELDEKIDAAFGEAEKYHEKVTALSKKADSLRARITANFDALGEQEKKRELLGTELHEIRQKEREDTAAARQAEEERERSAHEKVMADMRGKAGDIRERMKTGKKISFDELHILAAVDAEEEKEKSRKQKAEHAPKHEAKAEPAEPIAEKPPEPQN